MKHISFFFISVLIACQANKPADENTNYINLAGKTMGTSYHIKYQQNDKLNYQTEIDSILEAINNVVSTYEPLSLISQLNKNTLDITLQDEENVILQFFNNIHFERNYKESINVYEKSSGYFDPTVMPLVNYWGFGYEDKIVRMDDDSLAINNILSNVGFNKWTYSNTNDTIHLTKPINAELDFSAIAKGYAVDYLTQFLLDAELENFMIEIGGEIRVYGINPKGKAWSVGLNTPIEEASYTATELIVNLDNKALASSGNYRNFHIANGIKYGHEINPKTGYPEKNILLGVSVIADTCSKADAYATAFMVMGLEKALLLCESLKDVEACFFYGTSNEDIIHRYSSGFESFIKT